MLSGAGTLAGPAGAGASKLRIYGALAVDVQGTLAWTAGSVRLEDAATLSVAGAVTASADGTLFTVGAGGAGITVDGGDWLFAPAAGVTTALDAPALSVVNGGSVRHTSGNVSIAGGALDATAGAALVLTSDPAAGGGVALHNAALTTDATATLTANTHVRTTGAGASLALGGLVQLAGGSFELRDGSLTLTTSDACVVDNAGVPLVVTDGALTVAARCVVDGISMDGTALSVAADGALLLRNSSTQVGAVTVDGASVSCVLLFYVDIGLLTMWCACCA